MLDPAAAEFVARSQKERAQAKEAQAKPERETRLRPHETRRKSRQMNITFPSSAWTEAIREIARLRGLRPGDLVVWCVSYAISQVQIGAVAAPSGEGRKQHHTACEWMDDLPWEPGEKVTNLQERQFQAFEDHRVG